MTGAEASHSSRPASLRPAGWAAAGARRLDGLEVAGLVAALALIVGHVVTERRLEAYSPDSWAYVELARTVFEGELFRVQGVRQFQVDSDFSTSFPPLYPLVMALTDAALGVGPRVGFVLNHLLLVAILAGLAGLARRVLGDTLPGSLCFVLLIVQRGLREEVASGRAIPLSLVFLLALLHLLMRADPRRLRTAALAALAAGAWTLTRFDFALAAVALGFVVAWRATTARRRLQSLVVYGATLAATFSPWVVYSVARFGRPWISDNSRTVLCVETPFVADYIPHPELLPTLFTEPGDWLLAKLALAVQVLDSMREAALGTALPALLGLLAVALVARRRAVLAPEAAGALERGLGQVVASPALRGWAGLALVFVVLHGSIALTGYTDARYTTAAFLWLQLGVLFAAALALREADRGWDAHLRAGYAVALALTVGLMATRLKPGLVATLAVLGGAVVVAGWARLAGARPAQGPACGLLVVASLAAALLGTTPGRYSHPAHDLDYPPALLEHLRASRARLTMDAVSASRLAATEGVWACSRPGGLRPLTAMMFLERYEITHVQAGDPLLDALVAEAFEHERLEAGAHTLWVVRGRRPGVRLLEYGAASDGRGPVSDDRRAIDLADADGLAPGSRLVFNGSGQRVVREVEGARVWLDFPLLHPRALPGSAQDLPPYPVLALQPVPRAGR